MTLTPAQRRALEWLPIDMTWRPGDLLAWALHDLADVKDGFVVRRKHADNADWDGWQFEFRLTPAGVAERGRVGQ